VVVAGVVGLIVLNWGTEWLEHHAFPALWQRDRDVTLLIAGNLPVATSLLLGLCAGLGEEIALRGALQPRLGIVLSAVLFASAHVQYSWFGMATIGLLGLALGGIRARTNTTTVIVVHALYDVYAALTANT
jgi:membrane protease YdiL (CAAX protease family)